VTISHLSAGGKPISRSGENGKFSKMKNHVRGLIFGYIVVSYIIIKISTVSHLLMGGKAVSRCSKGTASGGDDYSARN